MKGIFLFGFLLLFNSALASEEQSDDIALIKTKIGQLYAQVEQLEKDKFLSNESGVVSVDLANDDLSSLVSTQSQHVLSNAWWQNFELYGFAAVGYYQTGEDANRPDGGFEIKEATLFIESEVWEDINFFLELQTHRYANDGKATQTGEAYLHFRNVPVGEQIIGFKAGRIDIPFGEDYLYQDSVDNPLITHSAAWPYGWDEGILVYGNYQGLGWIASLTDGSDIRNTDDGSEKALNLKIYGDICDTLYMSFSWMRNGDSSKSAIEFGGSHFEPVDDLSSNPVVDRSSLQVDAELFEWDGKYKIGESSLLLSYGEAKQIDKVSEFSRDLYWYSIEPNWKINQHWYTLLRYSEIGTGDKNKGFHFEGKSFANGNKTYGFEAKTFTRMALGLGWIPNPRIIAKFELGKDHFELIDNASMAEMNERDFIGLELIGKF
mgnify:CR=1 FL=1